jgi:hypothetical protein
MLTLLEEYKTISPSKVCADRNHSPTQSKVLKLKPGKYKHTCPSCKKELTFVRTLPLVLL